ncbi:tape measure protein (plasmid) [Skermanella sp. TT6]|uniref:Tape measure protein n=1 Tax=Skermanella cutis TaxID=2775420 RepID=A0ABX7BGN8_9PROT|nr:tape measure protein [Skermanella sp. TT6]QQP93566.1 tape measure protein [Skermanella sp. TT6]
MASGSNNTSDILVRIEATTAKLRSELQQAERSINSAASRMERDAARADRAVSSIGSGLQSALGAAGIGLSVAEIGRSMVKTIAEFERLDARIRGMTTSQGQFEEEQRFLSATAQRLGVDLATLTSSYAGLLQAQKSGKITGEQARAILEGMANASAATGASSEQLKLVFFGLNQVLGSATVTMEDVRQTTDPVPGLFEKVAQAGGKTTGELRKMISEGKVSAEVFSKLLVRALEDYEGAAEKAADGLNGSWTRVQNSWTEMVRTLETPIKNMLEPILDSARSVMDFYRIYGAEGHLPMEQRSPERLEFGKRKNKLNWDRAKEAGEPTEEFEKIDRQIDARLAFLRAKPVEPDKPTGTKPPIEIKPTGESEDEKKKREREAAQAAKRIEDTIENLRFEREQLGRTAEEQEVYNALKRAGVEANTEAGKKIAELARAKYAEEEALKATKKAIEDEADQRERGQEILKATMTPLEAYIAAVAEYKKLLDAGAISQGTFNMAVAAAAAEMDNATKKTKTVTAEMEYLEDFGSQAFDRIGAGITDAMLQGEDAMLSLKSVGMAVISELMQEFLKLSLINPIKNSLFDLALPVLGSVGSAAINGYTHGWSNMGGAGGTYGGFENGPQYRAEGGPVIANRPYIVGEKQAELFVPRVSGTIIPKVPNLSAAPVAAPAGDTIQVHLNISTGVQATVRAELTNMLPAITQSTKAAVASARQRGGSYSRAMGR